MPPALAGACLRWAPMAASISVSVALQLHLLTAAGKKAQQKVNIHLYRAPLLMSANLHQVHLDSNISSYHQRLSPLPL